MMRIRRLFLLLACSASIAVAEDARAILGAAGVKSGLIVHVGCGDGRATAALKTPNSIILGLDTDAANVSKAREHFASLKTGGTVSAEAFDGKTLPCVDSLANAVVAEPLGQLDMAEVMRALRPGGVACVKKNGSWTQTVKPWPKDLDHWTHYLHDPQGTSVSDDTVAGHSRGLRWTGGPFWARSHEHTAGMTAMVSAKGRVFYVMDEGPTESIQLPAQNILTARDAFNGVVLWKRPLKNFWNSLYPLKSGPGWLPRRLVAVGDDVYISPGIDQNLLRLDAATGKVACEYADTALTFELLVSKGVVFASVDPDCKACDYKQQHANCWSEQRRASGKFAWDQAASKNVLKALDAKSGSLLWKKETPIVPMSLVVDDTKVCFHDGAAMVALDRKTGKDLWTADVPDMKTVRTGYAGPRVILQGDKLIFSPMGHIVALSAETGKVLWSVKGKPRSGHFSLEDFYILDDKVWALARGNAGAFNVHDIETGKIVAQPRNPIKSFYIHQRCHPGKATRRFQLPPMMGMQVYDMNEDKWYNNHWVRGGCVYGAMPANGMIYVPPHACACYYQSKLNGFNALSPEPQKAEAPPVDERLVEGPAFGPGPAPAANAADWPTFRHDNARTSYVKTDVPAEVGQVWKKKFGTKITQPVAAGGKLFLSAIERHTVHALDAGMGKEAWHFIAGGRVNSPPTLYKGLALFGCADGWVYALRAADGALAWKFQAAPSGRKLVSYGQLESVWPLFGSVLVQDGKLYAVAGRSMHLDGGLRMVILAPETGELISENVMDRGVPETKKKLDDLVMGKHLPVSMPDILSGDGEHVYMKSQTFTAYGKRVRVAPQRPDTQYGQEVHLFSPISFLDDAWHQRTYWIYGRAAGEGWAEFQLPPKRVPCGRILCLDEQNAYSFGRDPELMCNTSVSEYRLFCAGKRPTRKVGIARLEGTWTKGETPDDKSLAGHTVDWHGLSKQPKSKLSALDFRWINEEPDVMARAMVLANDRLFIAGPRDVVDERKMWGRSNEDDFKKKMAEQAAWSGGKHGGVLQVYSKKDGKKLSETKLESLPAFDGLIAARSSLYLATQDGSIVCYRGK